MCLDEDGEVVKDSASDTSPAEAKKMWRGLQSMRELWLFNLEKSSLRGGLLKAYEYLKGGGKGDGDKLYSGAQ